MNSLIAVFAAPSFHDGSGSSAAPVFEIVMKSAKKPTTAKRAAQLNDRYVIGFSGPKAINLLTDTYCGEGSAIYRIIDSGARRAEP